MKTGTSFIKKGSVALLSGALVLAFSPAVFVPGAYADTTSSTSANTSLETVETAAAKIQTALEQNNPAANSEEVIALYNDVIVKNGAQDALTNDQLVYIISCESYQRGLVESENTKLSKQVTSLTNKLEQAQNELNESDATTLKTKTKISKLVVSAPAMGKLTASWKVTNSVDGIKYQVRYSSASGKKTTVTSKSTTKTFTKLSSGATYTFQVRAYKKIDGKKTYSSWSKKASATVIPKYRKGTYKVKGDALNVRKKASVSSDLLVSVLRGTKVNITSVKVVNGVVWGKLTYKGQTGWAQMQYLTNA